MVAFHTENGHVSLPATSSSKSGRTYWFGTTNQQKIPTLGDVLKWKDAGVEEDGPGQYMGASTYDDGKCAEPNRSPISAQRGVGPTGVGKPCKDSGFDIPKGLKPGTILTVYWVWDFSEHFGPNPNFFEVRPLESESRVSPAQKTLSEIVQWYSSCLDIDIIAGSVVSPSKPTEYNAPTRARIDNGKT